MPLFDGRRLTPVSGSARSTVTTWIGWKAPSAAGGVPGCVRRPSRTEGTDISWAGFDGAAADSGRVLMADSSMAGRTVSEPDGERGPASSEPDGERWAGDGPSRPGGEGTGRSGRRAERDDDLAGRGPRGTVRSPDARRRAAPAYTSSVHYTHSSFFRVIPDHRAVCVCVGIPTGSDPPLC